MPTRLLREGILKSERVDELDFAAEVFYRRLMSRVDDHGLYDARLSVLRADCFPLRLDRVREADIARWIAACEKAGLIVLYQSGGKPYLQMRDTNWATRSEPKYPLPTTENTCLQLQTTAPLVVDGDVVEVVDDKAPLPPGGGALTELVLSAYHEILPRCQRAEALTPKRVKRIAHADKLAKALCQRQGWDYQASEFWQAYFDECANDPWMAGDVPNPKNPRWKQNLDVLLAEDRFASIMDAAITAMRGAA